MRQKRVKKLKPKIKDIIKIAKRRKKEIADKKKGSVSEGGITITEDLRDYLDNLKKENLKIVWVFFIIGRKIYPRVRKQVLVEKDNPKNLFETTYKQLDKEKKAMIEDIAGADFIKEYLEYGWECYVEC